MIYLYAFFVLTFLTAIRDIVTKKSLQSIDAGVLTGIVSLSLLLVSLPFVIDEGIPPLDDRFFFIALFGGVCYYFGKYFNYQSLTLGDISLISPMKGLVTVVAVFSSMILLDEYISIAGALGIVCIFAGVYYLAIEKSHTRLFDPILALYRNPGSRMFLIAVCFYGFTVTVDRMGIQASSIWFWIFLMNSIVFLMSMPDLYRARYTLSSNFQKGYQVILILIFLHVAIYISHMHIVSEILAPYVSAFKSSAAFFSVILGGWIFSEKHILRRSIGAIVIILGLIIISIYG